MVFIVSLATSVRTQRAVKAIPRDEASPHCQNFTLEGLVFEGTDLSAFLFLLNLPFPLISLVSHVPSPDPLLPRNKSLLNPFFFPDTVVSLRNSLHFIPFPKLSSWVPATT
jgi:hypothetical protein